MSTAPVKSPKAAKKVAKPPAATPAKRLTKAAVKPATKPVAKPVAKAAVKAAVKVGAGKPGSSASLPSMRFYHSQALRDKTLSILEALEAAGDHRGHGDVMADLVTELIEAGMDYYFMRALKQAEVGFVVEQSARIGMSGAVKLISSVNRKFIVRMDRNQLLVVARHVRGVSGAAATHTVRRPSGRIRS